jgi:hypothetical protein
VRSLAIALCASSLLFAASVQVARADDDSAQRPLQSPKRTVPDYDGIGRPDAKGDNAGKWLARLLLSPLWFTTEYGMRQPAGALTTAVEKGDFATRVYDTFTFGPHHSMGIIPVGFIEFGFNPSVGVYGFWNDAFIKGNDIRLHYELWPSEWFGGSLTDRFRIDRDRWMQLRMTATRRPDEVFYGTGPDTPQWHQSRYGIDKFEASGAIETKTWRSSRIRGTLGVRKVDIFRGHYGSDPSIDDEARAGGFDLPFGFNRGYMGPFTDLHLVVDSRKRDETRGSSVRFEAESEQGADVEHTPASGWIRYGANAGAFIDLNNHGRILSLQVAALFADPLGGSGQIPFTELVTLGGDVWMRGYFPGRLVDRSAAIAQLGYSWPVAPKLGATMQAAVGNVFGMHLEDFDPKLLRISAAFGLEAHIGDPPLQFLVGFGSEPIVRGATIDSFRITVGIPRTF